MVQLRIRRYDITETLEAVRLIEYDLDLVRAVVYEVLHHGVTSIPGVAIEGGRQNFPEVLIYGHIWDVWDRSDLSG